MNYIFGIVLLLMSVTGHTWEGREEWNSDLSQELLLNCEGQESLCRNACDDQYQCRVETGYCRNCIGTNLFLSFFFQEVGRWFVNSGELLPQSFLEEAIRSDRIVLLSANSPYNIFSSVNDMKVEMAFNALCPSNWNSFPVVVGLKNARKELVGVEAVICHGDTGAEIYRLNSNPAVEKLMKKKAPEGAFLY